MTHLRGRARFVRWPLLEAADRGEVALDETTEAAEQGTAVPGGRNVPPDLRTVREEHRTIERRLALRYALVLSIAALACIAALAAVGRLTPETVEAIAVLVGGSGVLVAVVSGPSSRGHHHNQG
ncbi:MAG: hypothetical protein JWM48_2708 [Mycobacterium sp.]|jgi:hypothetical protein|nr:hypothetical protein [Mycobacterium sp.]MCW2746158.1 hypothetical protein [Mycobacterium sp.]